MRISNLSLEAEAAEELLGELVVQQSVPGRDRAAFNAGRDRQGVEVWPREGQRKLGDYGHS
uniref:Uncharacterized protein n=1 Tax=Spironucleus salmonicida TaxID=348837 RepID=V6LHL3_9EUKA|eukprot:EST43176.1 Hypothetical protein SS50377_17116 [Spironucleus salmonicida]